MKGWIDYVDMEAMASAPRHQCAGRGVVLKSASEAPSPSPREWGPAVGEIVRHGGVWWAVACDSSPPEYSSPIRYCPWCGVERPDTDRDNP